MEKIVTALAANKATIRNSVIALLVLVLVVIFWPSNKPPAPCDDGEAAGRRPGEAVQTFDAQSGRTVIKIIKSNCSVPAQAATPDEVKDAQARMAKWQAYLKEHPDKAAAQGGGLLSLLTGPVGSLLLGLASVWGVLLAVALLVFLISFLIVAVVAIKDAPLLVFVAPVMLWWKVLVEIPKALAMHAIDAALSKSEGDQLKGSIWQSVLHLLGIGKGFQLGHPQGDLGSAAFATAEHVAAKDQPGPRRAEVPVGHVEGRALTWHTDKHVFVLAGTRAGKGRDLIIPNLLTYTGSVLVIDPKAENYRQTYRYRAQQGTVRVLDPWGKTGLDGSQRARFNPLALLSKSNPESVDIADVIAHGIVIPNNSTDSHWSDSARTLWKMLMLHVATASEFEGARDLITARQILQSGFLPVKTEAKGVEAKEDKASEESKPPVRLSTIERMRENDHFDGVIADFAISLLATPEKERGSIISNAARQTDFLDTPALRAALSHEGEGHLIDFSEWRRGVMSCYVCIPADKLEGSGLRWVRLIVGAALSEMMKEDAPPQQPVQFILDELASLKRLEQVERAVGLAAGYGVQVWSVWQDLAQMKDLYHARWASFIGNAGARYVFGVGDYDTAKYFSDYMGQATRLVTAHSTDAVGLRLAGQNRSVQTRALMTPDEIMVMEPKEMLVLLDKMRPVKANRTSWDENPNLKMRSETGRA